MRVTMIMMLTPKDMYALWRLSGLIIFVVTQVITTFGFDCPWQVQMKLVKRSGQPCICLEARVSPPRHKRFGGDGANADDADDGYGGGSCRPWRSTWSTTSPSG
jgi:hypothetical protein